MTESTPSYTARDRPVLTPTQLNKLARQLLEDAFAQVWVEGEISNYTRAASGHWYFTLKDRDAQIRSAMFKSNNLNVRCKPENGTQVLVRGRISLYEARGDYQLICEHMEDAGLGRLMREFERLKALLQADGLTDAARKRPLPRMPLRIAVISSAQGAAIRDVLSVCARRWPLLQIDLFPAQVQGAEAPAQLRVALSEVLAAPLPYELVLLTRGGGSLEDLAAFNDETLARMIAASPIPTVSAVGHETDFTIADLVADVRAPTPSAAAELITPSADVLHQQLHRRAQELGEHLRRHLQRLQQRNDSGERLLRAHDPRRALQLAHLRMQSLRQRTDALMQSRLQRRHQQLMPMLDSLRRRTPQRQISENRQRGERLHSHLQTHGARWLQAPRTRLDQHRHHLRHALPDLDALHARCQQALASLRQLSPQATLQRGYVLLRQASDGKLVTRATDLGAHQALVAQFADGERKLHSDES